MNASSNKRIYSKNYITSQVRDASAWFIFKQWQNEVVGVMYVVCVASVTEYPSWTYQMVDKYPLPLSYISSLRLRAPPRLFTTEYSTQVCNALHTIYSGIRLPCIFFTVHLLGLFVFNQVVWATHQFLTIRVGNIHPQIELCPFVRFKSKPYMGSLVRYL